MDRNLVKLCLLGFLVLFLLLFLAFFAMAPIFCTSVGSLLYTLFYFILNESHEVHNAQEFENRFWTIFAILLSTAVIFAKDSPLAFGLTYPSLGFFGVLLSGYWMHVWDRNMHRMEIGKVINLKRGTTAKSVDKLHALGIPIEDQLQEINSNLAEIDKFYMASTFNNIWNSHKVQRNEKKIISIFEDASQNALNFFICHSQLALIFYKMKDHRTFGADHRTQLIELICIERVSHLNIFSKVHVVHALQMMKLQANTRAAFCVKNIIVNTKQDELSALKTLTDSKGDYFSMTKLVYDDIKSNIVREVILKHIELQSRVIRSHMRYGSTSRAKERKTKCWRKILSDVDDTLTCSAGSYPSGIDKRYGKKVVYPGVLGFYRELDLGNLGATSTEEWPENEAGNLVFLSARPHIYKDISEKRNFKKFETLQNVRGMHTMPSLLPGDIASGSETLFKDDFEPIAQKKFDNFRKYVSIYPEYQHVFICDNGQGDVRAAQLMVEAYPDNVQAIYVHVVQDISLTFKYSATWWSKKGVRPFFFKSYPEAALDAAKRKFILLTGLRRICIDTINDFYLIQTKQWPSQKHKSDRRDELNQALWSCNQYLEANGLETVSLMDAERLWKDGEKVKTPWGNGTIISFDKVYDLYEISLDWRSIKDQVDDYEKEQRERKMKINKKHPAIEINSDVSERTQVLETVFELDNEEKHINLALEDEESNESITSTNDVNVPTLSRDTSRGKGSSVTAKIKGKYISKYKCPILPQLPKDDGNKNVFSFWGSKSKPKVNVKSSFSAGDKCSTPFGLGIVVTYRETSDIVVLKMTGWNATCYLLAAVVKTVEEGFFESLFRKMTTPDAKNTSQRKLPSPKEFEESKGVDDKKMISTPYGEGRIINNSKNDTTKKNLVPKSQAEYSIVAIELNSWTLANNKHPILYCTANTVTQWKMNGSDNRSKSSGGILSAFLSLGKKFITKKIPTEIVVPKFEQYYVDGAAVITPFGNGRVESFRKGDGFYQVALIDWKLANKCYAKIFLKKDSLTYNKAPGCQEGFAVLTSYGISGILESVQPTTGIHIVTVPDIGMVCYLQPSDIVCPLKAVVGDDVLTPYGNGRVVRFRGRDKIYEVELTWGATLYCKAEAFDRDNNFDDRGSMKMPWVFKLFYSSKDDTICGSQRSRSNSVTSARTQSSLSLLS